MWQRYRTVYYLLREQGRGITGAEEGDRGSGTSHIVLGVSIQAITFNLAQTVSPVRVLVSRHDFSCNQSALINGGHL